MFTEWDERFDILVGADIRDSDAEACLDSGVHDLLHGESGQDLQSYSLKYVAADKCRVPDDARLRIT